MSLLVDERSCICIVSELDIFSVPPTQTSIENGSFVDYHPIAAIDDSSSIDFSVPGSSDSYLDLASTYLHLNVKITKANGGNIDDTLKVGPANLLLHTLFNQVDVSLNDKLVSYSSSTYAYRAYIETLLNYGKSAKETQLTAAAWYKDTAGKMDSTDVKENLGLNQRSLLASKSKTIDLIGRLHCDVFHQEKLMLSGVGMRVKLMRNKDSVVLISGEDDADYKVKITKAVLQVRKCRINPAISLSHARALESANAKYPIERVECKTFSIQANSLNATQQNVFMGQLPSRVVIGLVDHEAYNGNYKKNPFNFQNYKLSTISLEVDSQEQPVKPIQCNFDDNTFAEAYMSLFTGTGKAYKDVDIDVSRDDYAGGYTLFVFDLTPDLGESGHYSLLKTGSVRLALSFATALAKTVNVIVYAEFQNVLEVDRNRNVFYDFSA